MDCIDYRTKMIPLLNKELEWNDASKLLKHIMQCPQCREELRIQYLLIEGAHRLGHGGLFNLEKDYNIYLLQAEKECKKKAYLWWISDITLAGLSLLTIIMLIKGLLF